MSLHIIYCVGTKPEKCTNDPQLYTNGEMERCAEANQFNSLLLAVYLILTNMLLVNLLIAMFAYVLTILMSDNLYKKISLLSRSLRVISDT